MQQIHNYFGGVGSGKIPYSEAPENLTWGAAISSVFASQFLVVTCTRL